MIAFIKNLFKSKKQKQKELLDEITNTKIKEQATEAIVESIIKEVKKERHIDCECQECINRIKQNAK